MEGPSLFLAVKQLQPFIKKKVMSVSGNTTIEKDRFLNKKVLDIFSWGKHLLVQFDTFALRVHFLLYGTFSATIKGITVTGDYKKARTPRLALAFQNGIIELYNCSVKIYDTENIKTQYDFSVDIMAPEWDSKKVLRAMNSYRNEEVADVLLDQTVFSGVGNIIKNEVLSIVRVNPKTPITMILLKKRKKIIDSTHAFSFQFYRWREKFVLRKNLLIHRRSTCPHCGEHITREKTGKRQRWSYYCKTCQPLKA